MLKKYTLLTILALSANTQAIKSEEAPKINFPDLNISNDVLNAGLLNQRLSCRSEEASEVKLVPNTESSTDYRYTRDNYNRARVIARQTREVKLSEKDLATLDKKSLIIDTLYDTYTKCYITYAKASFWTKLFSEANAIEDIDCNSIFPEKLYEDAKKQAEDIKNS